MVSKIKLPGMTIEYAGNVPNKELLLVGGGRQPAKDWLQKTANGRTLWCIDHGIDICHELGLVPEILLGDFDSCNSGSLQWAKDHGTIIEEFDVHKDFSDTQAALKLSQERDAFCILTGALGKRFDHTYSTIFSFGHMNVNGCIADELEAVFFIHDEETISIALDHTPKAISLLPITDKVHGVTTQGLHWELPDTELTQGKPYAVSNVLAAMKTTHNKANTAPNSFTVSIKSGILALYICQTE